MGTAALVLGLCALATTWVPVVALLAWIAAILAIVFGSIGLARVNSGWARNGGASIAGLTLGVVALVAGPVVLAVWDYGEQPASVSNSAAEFEEEDRMAGSDGRVHDAEGPEVIGGPEDDEIAEETSEEVESAEEPEGIGQGIWEVGTEIAPGTYVTTSEGADAFDGCYVARLSGFGGEFDEIIANAIVESGARGRITVGDGDIGVEFSGDCTWFPAAEGNLADPGPEVGQGVWEVGTEIAAGTYTTTAEDGDVFDGCYVARLSGFGMTFDELIANDIVDAGAQGRIEIAESDAGVEFSGDCVWVLQ